MLNSPALIIGILGLIVILAVAFARIKKAKKLQSKKTYRPYANTADVRALPEYKKVKRQYHLLVAALSMVFVVILASITIVSARPVSVTTSKPNYENRDIMVCLDISGSMNDYVSEMLNYFAKAMDNFKGQRVGITVFDGVYMTLSPLSDDYEALSSLFVDVAKNPFDYSYPLYQVGQSSSEIGPGLVGCVNSFDKLGEEERSRAIILVTDNYASKTQAVSLSEAANYAKQYDIAVYGLSTSDWRSQAEIDSSDGSKYESENNKEFRESMLATGGAYYTFSKYSDDEIAVKQIAERIMEQSAARYEGVDTLVYKDEPLIPSIVTAVGLAALFVMIWRMGL